MGVTLDQAKKPLADIPRGTPAPKPGSRNPVFYRVGLHALTRYFSISAAPS